MTLRTLLLECSAKDLKRAYRSDKAYIYISVSVFNAGAVVRLICTDVYKAINYGSWNGYDQIHENDSVMNTFILEVMKEKGVSL